MTELKVGDRIKRTSNHAKWAPLGYETTVTGKPGELTYTDIDGDVGVSIQLSDWSLVQPTGPVVTETVTKTRIVPGTYSGVDVGGVVDIPDCENPDRDPAREVYVCLSGYVSADQLDAAAAVLSALAKGLRDA